MDQNKKTADAACSLRLQKNSSELDFFVQLSLLAFVLITK
jgi:hypothetical protein